ncbi:MAG: hypothetical protein WDZ41_03400 [Candidatus Babeliales bacterium]
MKKVFNFIFIFVSIFSSFYISSMENSLFLNSNAKRIIAVPDSMVFKNHAEIKKIITGNTVRSLGSKYLSPWTILRIPSVAYNLSKNKNGLPKGLSNIINTVSDQKFQIKLSTDEIDGLNKIIISPSTKKDFLDFLLEMKKLNFSCILFSNQDSLEHEAYLDKLNSMLDLSDYFYGIVTIPFNKNNQKIKSYIEKGFNWFESPEPFPNDLYLKTIRALANKIVLNSPIHLITKKDCKLNQELTTQLNIAPIEFESIEQLKNYFNQLSIEEEKLSSNNLKKEESDDENEKFFDPDEDESLIIDESNEIFPSTENPDVQKTTDIAIQTEPSINPTNTELNDTTKTKESSIEENNNSQSNKPISNKPASIASKFSFFNKNFFAGVVTGIALVTFGWWLKNKLSK